MKQARIRALTYTQRLTLLTILAATGALLLVSRIFLLQLVERPAMVERAERLRLGWSVVRPRRGDILDARGRPLAVDAPGFELGIKARSWMLHRFECKHCGRVYYRDSEKDLPSKCHHCRKPAFNGKKEPLFSKADDRDLLPVARALGIPRADLRRRIENRVGWVQDKIEGKLTGLSDDKYTRRKADLLFDYGRRHYAIKRDVPYEVVREVALNPRVNHFFSIRTTTSRRYPRGPAFTHLLGSLTRFERRRVKETDETGHLRERVEDFPVMIRVRREERVDDAVREQEFVKGASGLELGLEAELRGKEGWVEVRRDPRTGKRTVLDERRARDGVSVVLTIDAEDQQAAYEAMRGEPGAFVVVNAETGAVLALASSPSYDLEEFGTVNSYWRDRKDVTRSPLYDRSYKYAQIPGSVMKPFTAIAAYRSGDFTLEETVLCEELFYLNGRPLESNRCAHHHGPLDLHGALVKSCNVYFQTLLDRMRQRNLVEVFHGTGVDFGFGRGTGLEVEPDSAQDGSYLWGDWHFGGVQKIAQLVASAIGQGEVTLTPPQVARAYAGLATGYLPRLHLVKRMGERETTVERTSLDLDPALMKVIRQSLREVVQPGGTAFGFRLDQHGISAKTGTAQTGRHRRHIPIHNGWMAGYAPARIGRPPIAFAMVVLETPGSGAEACGPKLANFFQRFYATEKQ
jgi:cell division protein FtsI/penicillin-binding protein 2